MKNNQIMIVSDIAGVGNVSSNVLYPLFSLAQFEPTVLPTLLLSSNTEANKLITQNTDDIFSNYLNIWNELHYTFNSFVTGYFATISQISLFTDYYLNQKATNPSSELFVDSTMGDFGELYLDLDKRIPAYLRQLIEQADIVKPNITEACLLTGHPYKENMDINELTELAKKVSEIGAKNTILTGIKDIDEHGNKQIGFLYYDQYGHSDLILHNYFDQEFFGTGDLVFGLIILFYLYGDSLHSAIIQAADLVEYALQNTVDMKRQYKYGINFQSIFPELMRRLIAY